jgi:hypothetical protein
MTTFGTWLWANQARDADTQALSATAAALGAAWPIGAARQAEYEAALAGAVNSQQVVARLDKLWRVYEEESSKKTGVLGWLGANFPLLVTCGLAGAIIYLLSGIQSDALLANLATLDRARGLITFLFAVVTVGAFVIVLVANFTSSLGEKELAARFQHGKDLLTLLIGIFGTILGFYFGQATGTGVGGPGMGTQALTLQAPAPPPPAPQTPAPQAPASQTPATQAPAPQAPAPQASPEN